MISARFLTAMGLGNGILEGLMDKNRGITIGCAGNFLEPPKVLITLPLKFIKEIIGPMRTRMLIIPIDI